MLGEKDFAHVSHPNWDYERLHDTIGVYRLWKILKFLNSGNDSTQRLACRLGLGYTQQCGSRMQPLIFIKGNTVFEDDIADSVDLLLKNTRVTGISPQNYGPTNQYDTPDSKEHKPS
eukprot:IDg21610t1